MADKPSTTKVEKAKPVRKHLTPAERIAKAERDLADLRKKEEAKAAKVTAVKQADLDKLVAKSDEINARILKLRAEIGVEVDAYGNDDEGDAS